MTRWDLVYKWSDPDTRSLDRAAINADGPLNWDTDEVAAQRLAAAYAEGEPE